MLFDFNLIRLLNIGQLTILKFSNPDFTSAHLFLLTLLFGQTLSVHIVYIIKFTLRNDRIIATG